MIHYKKPTKPKEVIPFSDGTVRNVPFQKFTIYVDRKGKMWHSTVDKNMIFSKEAFDFCYQIKRKPKKGLEKILNFWE